MSLLLDIMIKENYNPLRRIAGDHSMNEGQRRGSPSFMVMPLEGISQMRLGCISSIQEELDARIPGWLTPNLSLFFQQAGLRSSKSETSSDSPLFDSSCPAGLNLLKKGLRKTEKR